MNVKTPEFFSIYKIFNLYQDSDKESCDYQEDYIYPVFIRSRVFQARRNILGTWNGPFQILPFKVFEILPSR
jgi:hypothetical protein